MTAEALVTVAAPVVVVDSPDSGVHDTVVNARTTINQAKRLTRDGPVDCMRVTISVRLRQSIGVGQSLSSAQVDAQTPTPGITEDYAPDHIPETRRSHRALGLLVEELRRSIAVSAIAPFAHAPYPLTRTLHYRGDSGLLGPGSVSWMVIADIAALVGGIRSLLIQAAHPEVVAGVSQHSRYQEDPLGRLSRTSAYIAATTYGSIPEVEQAISGVKRIHRAVRGVSGRGVAYAADDPGFAAWVHNALTDSFLTTHRAYGGIPISPADADRFVVEQTRIGALLGAEPMPETQAELSVWIESHSDLAWSAEMEEAVEFLTDPPLPLGLKLGYRALLEAAIVTIPKRIRDILGVTPALGAGAMGRSAVAGLRWALGYSPSWRLALERCDEMIPDQLFKQRPRVA